MKQNITILGWTDWLWKWLAEFLLKHFSEHLSGLILTWMSQQKWKELIAQLQDEYKNINIVFSTENNTAVKNADITVFSVPIGYMQKTIESVAPHLKKWSVVLDVCSIKHVVANALREYAPDWVLIIPTHPMFWPSTTSITEQIFVLTPDEETKDDSRYIFLKQTLKRFWSKVLEAKPDEHDKMMAVVQWLTHYNLFVFWETVKRLEVDIEKSLNFVSPIYKLMLSSVARYMSQNPKLYWDIQMHNEENKKVHKTFIEVSQDFSDFVRSGDEEQFIQTIKGSQEYFWENAMKGQVYTDKVIFLLSKQVELIHENIWKALKFENIYSWEILTEVVEKYENEIIYLEQGRELLLDEWRVFE